MAKGDMDDFLRAYYRRLHTDAMPYDVLARLVKNKKDAILTAEQETWFDPDKGFLVADSTNNNPYKDLGYRARDLPKLDNSDGELTPDELEKLYKRFAKAMAGMKSASADYGANDGDAKDFVKRFVDDIKLFPIPAATQECADSISKLVQKLDINGKTPEEQETIKNIKQVILDETRKVDKPDEKLFTKTEDIDKLLKKCADGKYNTDTSVQSKIQQVARTLDIYLNSWSYTNDNNTNTKQKNKEYLGDLSDALSIIDREDAFSEISINSDKLNAFRDIYAKELLDILYHNKDVREKFGAKDPKLVEIITKAEDKISYQDPNSSEYLTPKTDDVLTPLQQVEKWATDTYNNSIRKYSRLRGDPLLFSPFSKEICKAIDKEKVKPTDGIEGLLGKADAIKKRIPNKTVMEHFDWFIETMNQIKDKKPKALAGAWNNAAQMKCVITEIILKATGPNSSDSDMEKAKTAMEIMTAMKYGMMTSKVMDAMRGTDFNIFSDGKLSWNKNEGMQFVTSAFDKGIKAAFLGVGYGVTFARNKIMMSGMKFKDKNNKNGSLGVRMTEEKRRLTDKQARDQSATNDANNETQQEITEQTREASHLQNEIRNQAAREANYQQLINSRDAIMTANQANHDAYKNSQEFINNAKNNPELAEYRTLYQEWKQLTSELTALRAELGQYANRTDAAAIAKATSIQSQIDQKEPVFREKSQKLNEITTRLKDPNYLNRLRQARTDVANFQSDYDTYEQASQEKNNFQTKLDELTADPVASKQERLNDATDKITELNETINERNEALTHWEENNVNKVKQLEDFWNFLQTGKSKTWRLNTKKAQEKFDANKNVMYANWVSQHGMAA